MEKEEETRRKTGRRKRPQSQKVKMKKTKRQTKEQDRKKPVKLTNMQSFLIDVEDAFPSKTGHDKGPKKKKRNAV